MLITFYQPLRHAHIFLNNSVTRVVPGVGRYYGRVGLK